MSADGPGRYRSIFKRAPVALWEQDFTAAFAAFEQMRADGIEDFRGHFTENPQLAGKLAAMISVLEVNEYALDLFGASSKEELVGSLDRVFVPETYPVFVEELIALASGEKQFAAEAYASTLQGTYIYVYFNVTMLPPEDGDLRGLITIVDITRRKRVEDALVAQKNLYHTMTEATPHMIWMADADSRITYCNQAMQDLTGVSLDDARGRDWTDVIGVEDSQEILRARRAAKDEGTNYRGQCRFHTTNGVVRSIYFIDTPVKGDTGEILHRVGIGTDITELEQAQERLEKSLDRSNRELAQIAYASSHDLQEPLRMVTSFAQLLHQRYGDQLGEQADKYIDYITEGAQRIGDLIKGLLTLSNVSKRGREPVAVDADELVGRVLSSMRPALQDAGGEVSCDELPMVMADPQQLAEVFRNLLHNSIKFRGESKLTVKVSARREGDQWLFEFEDNGIGFDADEYGDRVFEMFRRLHTRDKYPGNGMGLALVQKIVERHGGRVWVASTPGAGTSVFFTMPAVEMV